jgi:glycerol-3-phosphate dehydrogenase
MEGYFMINRDIGTVTRREFDLVIVGGGIYGISLLQEAARRGLSACLCEADDFGGATSWNSLRIVHGGLRYLQTLDLRRFFQSVASRRRVALQFPALVRPLDCLMPLYGQGMKRASVMRMALLLNDLLSSHRNSGVAETTRLPGGRVLDAPATCSAFPRVRSERLEGAATWCDYFMLSSERILMELLHDACRHGGMALNYAPVLDVLSEGSVARGVRIRDRVTGSEQEIVGRTVVNCAGPQVRRLARGQGGNADELFRPSLAFNVLLDLTLPTRSALAVAAPQPGAPILFVVPQERTLFAGTLHLPRPAGTTEALATEAELAQYLGLLNAAIPGLDAGLGNIRRVFAGLLPAAEVGSNELVKREVLLDHGKTGGLRGFYSISGVKFTTANDVACLVLSLIGLRDRAPAEVTGLPLSPSTDLLTSATAFLDVDDAVAQAMLRQVVADEAVQCVDDFVLRRTNWAMTEPDLDRARERVARLTQLPFDLSGEYQCV